MKNGTHRAMDDIRQSVEELRFYREHVFVTPAHIPGVDEPAVDV